MIFPGPGKGARRDCQHLYATRSTQYSSCTHARPFSPGCAASSLPCMRSKGPTERPGAAALGALIYELALRAGYDLRPGGTGRTQLSEATGMSVSAIGRMLRGETLPKVENVYLLAEALKVDEGLLLDTAGYRAPRRHTDGSPDPLLSVRQVLTPEGVADALGITNPFVRKMLISSIDEAMRLQREANESSDNGGTGGQAVAR